LERGYVKKMDVDGKPVLCNEFVLEKNDKTYKKLQKERTFGTEKAKLVIQPMGILVLEFLINHFESLFSYDYTKQMEEELDKISNGDTIEWSQLCSDCNNEIKLLAKSVSKLSKQIYKLDDDHDLLFERYGPVIRRHNKGSTGSEESSECVYVSVNKEIQIDLEKLKRGEYTVEELRENSNVCLGKYQEVDMMLKNGKYGPYVEWGEKNESIKDLK
jgi:DNA topoisomerase-1